MADDKLSEWVTFVSNDDYKFYILRSAAIRSNTVKRMLEPRHGFKESLTNICVFENISGIVLEKVCQYLYFHERYDGMTNVPDMEIPPEISLELALAADFLDC